MPSIFANQLLVLSTFFKNQLLLIIEIKSGQESTPVVTIAEKLRVARIQELKQSIELQDHIIKFAFSSFD
jgi:hypothetical protein